ncbi:MAG: ABC transporter substrate-binding protein [Oligosphaeraceae bacterium]|nr:ABC transporter substrate-binding protein [Oligosphaeraceae bacterium]
MPNEYLFGGGLKFQRVSIDSEVYHLRMDHSSGVDNGCSHVPTPFVATTAGFGFFCDTIDDVSLYMATAQRYKDKDRIIERDRTTDDNWRCNNPPYFMEIAVNAPGVKAVIFQGESLRDCICRFNLYCGGGFLPPKWGLGVWHRTNIKMDARQVQELAADYKRHQIALDVIGLEPGWQSKAYPCSYDWSKERFPDPADLIGELKKQNIRVNLWENPYVSEHSSIYQELKRLSGSHLVWGGIVPDYALPETRKILKKHHEKNHLDYGVSGYKLDESDGYDAWLWPDHAEFPSGLSGKAYRNVCGVLFQRFTTEMFKARNQRTYGLTRSSNCCAVSFPCILYNDRYDFHEYVTALCSCCFTGTLWCPELHDAKNAEDFLRRMQLIAFSPMVLINAWATELRPWMFPEVETAVRQVLELRQQLLPYLYTAFARYHQKGLPPIRSVFMDYGYYLQTDNSAGKLDATKNPYQVVNEEDINDQLIFGDSLMVCPIAPGTKERTVLFPPGNWYDFYSGQLISQGKDRQTFPVDINTPTPLFVPENKTIPLLGKDKQWTLRSFGPDPEPVDLYEDDGESDLYLRGQFQWFRLYPDGRREQIQKEDAQ